MTSPPAHIATTEPARGIKSCEREPDLSTQNGRQRHVMAELGVTAVQAHHKLRAFENTLRDRSLHAEAAAAGGFDDAHEVVREIFLRWFAGARGRLRASDPRRDGFRQR